MSTRPALLLSFDFEDWHQLVHRNLGLPDWDRPGPALERQLRAIFALLDDLEVKATFFLLGMTVRNHPHLVEAIAARGDEIACHGNAHNRVYTQTPGEFRRDVETSLELIERIAGRRPVGYRAPAFSINRDTAWAYEILAELGFRYDSSQYASPRIPRRIDPIPPHPYRLELPSGKELWELPIAVWKLGRTSVPVGGGAYWSILPEAVLTRGLRSVTAGGAPGVLYFHPYECDPSPLEAALPSEATAKQRLRAGARGLRRNLGRARVLPRIRRIGEQFRYLSYGEALGEIDERFGASAKALRAGGVLV